MNKISDKTNNYLNMLEEKFDYNNFCEFIQDLLNLQSNNIINSRPEKATSEQYKHYIETSQLYAKYSDSKRRCIGVIIVKLYDNKNPANARTLQRNYIAHLLKYYNLDAALSAIYSNKDDTWRLSFIKQELDFGDGKLKNKFTPAKRYSYLFGKDEPNHTAKEQLLDLLENNEKQYSVEEIEEKFSVEKVTKDFFENYKENYLKLKETLDNNEEFLIEAKRCDFSSEEFAKKLMGQIVFIYFLQKKGWLGVKLVPQKLSIDEYNDIYNKCDVIQKKILDKYYITFDNSKKIKTELLEKYNDSKQEIESLSDIFSNTEFDSEWGTGEKRFIRAIYNNCLNRRKNFFDDYLEPFFYDGLNHKRKNQYFSLFNCKIPFLNGGLFEPLDNYQWEIASFNIDNSIFSNKEGTGILDFFDRYNFTMNEEEPLEKDVAVDPEMLGKIFENLLDVKDRKSKGAFYTPREIVHYMCQESIANYLVNKVGVKYEEIKEFIQYGELMRDLDLKEATLNSHILGESVFNNIIEIDKALENVKIADPAVGSGAFPLGMLNEIVKLRDIITSYLLIYNKLGKFDKIYPEERITNNKRSIYNIKWNTIKNSIYAVDIENSAVDITKLRLWLSIVVDQVNVPKSGPEPLPNLDFKIMQGNSLVDEYDGIKLIDKKFVDEFRENKNIRFNNSICKIKKGKKSIEISGDQIQFGDGQKKASIDSLISLKQELYGTNDPNRKKELLDKIQTARHELLRLNFAGTKYEDDIFEIDKSHNKPYFAWMLEFIEVFIDNNGFDIVIGNPPYIGESGNKDIFRDVAKTQFGKKYYTGKMDFWYFFTSKGLELLHVNGILSFIAPNNWTTTTGGKNMRKHIMNEAQLLCFISFGDFMVFSSASQQTMIFILSKNNLANDYKLSYNDLSNYNDINCSKETVINRFLNKSIGIHYNCQFKRKRESNEPFYFVDNNKQIVINHIKDNEIIYLDKSTEIAQGIVFPQDTLNRKSAEKLGKDFYIGQGVFVITEDELALLNLNEDEKKVIKPYYTTEQIKKWATISSTKLYLIYANKNFINNIDEYPHLKKHLDKFSEINTSDNKPYGLHRARNQQFFQGEKIISVRKCIEPTFSYSDFDVYVSQTFNIIKQSRINNKYLLGILNSKVVMYWLRFMGKMQGTHFQVDAEPLSSIPICINKNYKNELIKLVNQRIDGIENEDLINNLVYKIYNLSQGDIIEIEKTYDELKKANEK